LYFDHRDPDSIPYHYRQQFRSWERDWGFCIPRRVFDQLTPGEYDVVIRTSEAKGELKILEYTHEGTIDRTIVLGGNLDHAGVANDGLAGCVVGLEVLRRLQGRRTRFSYSLVLSPGIIGSEHYLAGLTRSERSAIVEGIFLEMLGSNTALAVQETRSGKSNAFFALRNSLDRAGLQYRTGPFESIIINDEYIWENYGIPMISFSRFPYPEYHSSKDNADIIQERSLEEAVDALMGAVEWLEASPLVLKKFQGNVCLSNPRYDLYIDYGQIALGDTASNHRKRLRHLMDFIPSIEKPMSVRAIAEHVGLPEGDALEYLQQWAAKGLVELV
jgi:aminopeptidase-like protein